MATLQTILKRRLESAERIAVLAIGSTLRGDDAAGIVAAQKLKSRLRGQSSKRLRVFFGETAPENFTGEIRKYSPTHLVLLDAAEMGRRPGHIEVIRADAIRSHAPASTHTLPLGILIRYLMESLHCETLIIGIQPARLEFGLSVSPAAQRAAHRVAAALAACVDRK